ncbi:plasmid recombination protein [Pseudoramibacter faecis]|uniref:plasmid recombination protein n=1 Tax=Pseudoramibacter faecis TaxID=3108534 RepID=UPI003CC96A4B
MTATQGEENVIYAQVHKNESEQLHSHYGFVPITRDETSNHETEFKVCKKPM